ncbi:hypothetical protein BVC93_08990 [Mycobacterium sp. MS1601]|uniref:hypothetical protein n=1 Tax=Mycobacterium sp. MS1601 TaxID=1936029 RepID=UPI0009791AB8|nr:hypothetical protein [Mycobacterium sp. MS1601]AQA02545.1 hypothetical protein BVC93_08990 [Mycobacterium sp. MS1601]
MASGRLFVRNGYALVLNTVLSGGLGLLYWVLAARNYTDADVGRNSAAISSLMLLTGMVSVNAAGTLNRFIPKAGRRTRVVVAWIYALTSLMVGLLALALVVLLHWVGGPAFDLLREPEYKVWFVVAAIGASVITVQDSVMTGLRSAVWVPLFNGLFATGKIVLLVMLADTVPHAGVFFSWIVPMIIVIFPANLLIFLRLLPRHMAAAADDAAELDRGQIGGFFAADYLGSLFLMTTIFVVPVVVATRVDPHSYAYFFFAWSIATSMNLVAANLATSMAVEGVYDESTLADNCRSALRRALILLLFAAVTIGLAAPYALGLVGKGYLDAAPLLQLVAFASLPAAVVEIYLGTLRARALRLQIVAVQFVRGVTVLGLVHQFLSHGSLFMSYGDGRLTAVGVAFLLGQLITLVMVLPGLGRLLGWFGDPPAEPLPMLDERPVDQVGGRAQ